MRRLLVAGDLAALALALALVVALVPSVSAAPLRVALTLPIWIAVFAAYGLYGNDLKRLGHTTIAEIPRVFHAMLLGCVLFAVYTRLDGFDGVTFLDVLALGVAGGIGMLVVRSVGRTVARRMLGPERVLVVGRGDDTTTLISKLRAHQQHTEPVAVADALDLARVVETEGIDRLVVSSADIGREDLVRLLRDADRLCVRVSILPQFYEAIGAGAGIEQLGGTTLLAVGSPAVSGFARVTKRVFDLISSVLLLVVLAPLLAVIAAAIKLESRGPVIFRQDRVGRGGRCFPVLKFRTMVDGAEAMTAALRRASRDPHWLLLDHDPRITRVGRWLRLTSLDELPQLWNVVRGEMSLVGPRPLIPADQAHVAEWGRRRLDVTPGLTGLWQVVGRTAIPFEEMVELDCLYVANWSLWRDFELLLGTIPALLTARGAN